MIVEQKLIKDICPGDTIISFYILRKKEVRQKRSSGDNQRNTEK